MPPTDVKTIVCFHAHPDDEAIATGGVMAKAAAEGHRVVLVVATRGEHGEIVPDVLADGEQLWERRVEETHQSAEILGVQRVEFLGYVDSGMMGTPENELPATFWQADVEEAARALAVILEAERADVLTVYDDNGSYGHPDHIQVHRVGVRAAELAGTPVVYESTINRDRMIRMMREARERGVELPLEADPDGDAGPPPDVDMDGFGKPESALTTCVDVRPWLELKRRALQVHRSQVAEDSWFLAMPEEAFTMAFGEEWFIRRGARPGPPYGTDLLDDHADRLDPEAAAP